MNADVAAAVQRLELLAGDWWPKGYTRARADLRMVLDALTAADVELARLKTDLATLADDWDQVCNPAASSFRLLLGGSDG